MDARKKSVNVKAAPAKVFPGALRVAIALIVIAGGVCFYSALGNGFTNWDDDAFLLKNETIRALDWSNIKEMFTTAERHYYGPLFFLSFAVEYHFFSYDPFIYHLDNVLLHIINSLLVFWLILILCRRMPVALVTGLLFAVHPLHVESVAWITERKDVLFGFFYLLAVIFYLKSKERRYPLFFCLSFICALFSCLAKPMAVSLPFALILCDVFQRRRIDAKAILEKAPFFLLAVMFALITVHFQKVVGGHLGWAALFWRNALVSCKAVVFYIYKTALPLKLSALYPYPGTVSIREAGFLLSVAAVIGLILIAAASLKRTRVIFFSIFFFFATIGPVIGIIRIGRHFIAERYMYIPSVGLFFLFASFWEFLYRRSRPGQKAAKVILIFLLAAGILWLGALTYKRNKVWRTSEALWKDVLRQFEDNTVALLHLGKFYASSGQEEKAEELFLKILKRENNAHAYYNLGRIKFRRKDYEKAVKAFRAAVLIDEDYPYAYEHLARALYKNGRLDEAIEAAGKAIQIEKDNASCYFTLGMLYRDSGDYEKSVRHLEKAHALKPDNIGYLMCLGLALYKNGEYERAVAAYKKVLALEEDAAEAYAAIGLIYAGTGKEKEALEYFERAFSTEPALRKKGIYREPYEKIKGGGGQGENH